jgi:hypothetical protein
MQCPELTTAAASTLWSAPPLLLACLMLQQRVGERQW